MATTSTARMEGIPFGTDKLFPDHSEPESDTAEGHASSDEKRVDTELAAPLDSPLPHLHSQGDDGPPNGGFTAWLQVLSSFFIFFNTWGVLNTFGIFQTYYETGALFHQSSSNISWIGAIQAYTVLISGIIAGPIYDRGYLLVLVSLGSFLVGFGFMMLSLCTTYWQALLAQGFCIGIGGGLLFVPSMAVLPGYFTTRMGLATGLAVAGSSFGGIIYPIVFYRLLNQVGFPWAVRTVGFLSLATLLVPVLFMRARVKPVRPRELFDWTMFTDIPIVLFTLFTLVGYVGLYVVLFYISYFALASGSATQEMSFYLVPILNAASMLGRTIPNALSDKVGPLNSKFFFVLINLSTCSRELTNNQKKVLIPGSLICAALTFSLIAVNSLAGVIIVALLYGFFSGVFIALPPVCFVALTADKSKVGTRMGMGFAFLGFGVLSGGPGGGSVLGSGLVHENWVRLWSYGGTMTIASTVLMLGLRMWLTGGRLWVRI